MTNNTKSDNWVSKKMLIINSIFIFAAFCLSFLFLINIYIGIIFVVFTLFFTLFLIYFLYARYQFSPNGKDIQNKIYNLVLDYINFNGKGSIIDIGCGNASFLIKLAKKYPDAELTGIDYWEGMWDYTKEKCENNIKNAGIKNKTVFIKGSAADLPFKNSSFDLAVSNFVFHEVKDKKNKTDIIKEALRVVKKGGRFVFHDLFLLKSIYGNIDNLIKELKSSGIKEAEFIKTSNSPFIPKLLKLPFMTGRIGIIKGIK